ncbi:MAG: hypothetical protein LH480_04060 [Rubrivivax sp.]|nr:hypothetical protein [Rubrivivax sp.]
MSSKDAGMRVRVERELRDGFIAACQSQGLVAAEVLRDFMRGFAAKHSTVQRALFDAAPVLALPAAPLASEARPEVQPKPKPKPKLGSRPARRTASTAKSPARSARKAPR